MDFSYGVDRTADIVKDLMADIDARTRQLKADTDRLATIRRLCDHQWGEVVYAPLVENSYTIPADPPGMYGSDWRGEIFVPAETTKIWKRTCKRCCLTQETRRTEEVSVSGPIEGTVGTAYMPVFPS